MNGVYAMVLAGGVGSRLSNLTEQRAKPAVPFGGKFRIIDFVLSNCANSGISDVGLLTQYRPLSLIDHVGTGGTWDLDRSLGGLQILQPYLDADRGGGWYRGTADAVFRNLSLVKERDVEDVLVLSGDHVYAMDYRPFLQFHRERRFPATVAVTPVPEAETSEFGIVETDETGVIRGFQEKPKHAKSRLASMGVYMFRRDTLIRLLEEDAIRTDTSHDFGKDIFPRLTSVADVGAYTFQGYWQDIGTVEAFYSSNLKLLEIDHLSSLGRPDWPIRTPSVDAPPAQVRGGGEIVSSLVANGAVVEGRVEGSILFPGVVVERGAVVKDSVIMNSGRISENAVLERCVVDKRVLVGQGARVGGAGAGVPNVHIPGILTVGLTLLGKDVEVGPGASVGRNVCIGGRCKVDADAILPDGSYEEGRPARIAGGVFS